MSSDDRAPLGLGVDGAAAGSSQDDDSFDRDENQRIRLVRGGGIVLERDGFRIIEVRGIKRSPVLPYESITHIAPTAHALLIATVSGLRVIPNRDFPDPETGPETAREALLARIATRPDRDFCIERMAGLEALSRRKPRNFAVWGVMFLCVVGTISQWADASISQYGSFVAELFSRGELWRAVTAHFIHGAPTFPVHLAFNLAGLAILGHLVERPLGTFKTVVVFALGAAGAIIGSVYYGNENVVGASGLVTALAGAILAMELHHPDELPASWRLPRRLFIGVLVVQFLVIDQIFSSFLAGGAHLGGFAGGYLAVWLFGGPVLDDAQPSPPLRVAAMTALLVLAMGLAPIVPLVRHDAAALERHALRLLNTPLALGINHDNAVAWFIVTEGEPSPTGLDLAVALADRAATATGRRDPNILDTLAEALFQAGETFAALLVIDEAIRLAPAETYFHEQRRRFTGERAADDRPAPPGSREADDFFGDEDDIPIDPDAPAITL